MFFSKLKSAFVSNSGNEAEVKYSDSFADTLALDLKRCSIEAILAALSKTEGKYLSTILQSSFFPVESIVFTPLDNETAVETDNFFKIHSAIDPTFEQNFYRTIMLKEYRTEHGGVAMPSDKVTVTVQPSEGSADNLTEEESYQITLRGSKKRFGAQVILGNPRRLPDVQSSQEIPLASGSKKEPSFGKQLNQSLELGASSTKIEVTITDGDGSLKKVISLPAIVGRDGESQFQEIENKLLINARYVSRNQIVLFSVGSKAYFFIPESSKLLAVVGGREILNKMKLIEVSSSPTSVTFGQPDDTTNIQVQPGEPGLYPTITLKLASSSPVSNATPIPHVS